MSAKKPATWQEIHQTLLQPNPPGGVARMIQTEDNHNFVTPSAAPGDVINIKFSNPNAPSNTTLTDGGGKKLGYPQVNIIFWGNAWSNSPAPSPDLNAIVSDAASIIGSVYLDGLAQYGCNGASLGAVVKTAPGNNPPTNYTMAQVNSFIVSVINSGGVPSPDDTFGDQLYFAIMPPGTIPPPNLSGEHSITSFTDYSFPFSSTTVTVYTAFVAFGARSQMSAVFGHELVEAMTDPDGTRIQVNPTNPTSWNEIADICQTTTAVVNGITLEPYWSQVDKSCIIPELQVEQMEITCIVKPDRSDTSEPMTAVGGFNHTQNIAFRMTQKDCIASIDRGNHFFVKNPQGGTVSVGAFSHYVPGPDNMQLTRYIATLPDNTKLDNLLSLPECT